MAKQARDLPLPALTLDASSPTPLHRQIYFEIRSAILDGRLKPGARLPASRSLARDLRISRNTVTTAFDQLAAEGYIEARTGAGSFVPAHLPRDQVKPASTTLSARCGPGGFGPVALTPSFPADVGGWRAGFAAAVLAGAAGGRSLSVQGVGAASRQALAPAVAQGPDRCSALAAILGFARRSPTTWPRRAPSFCRPEQVIVTAGSRQALDLGRTRADRSG